MRFENNFEYEINVDPSLHSLPALRSSLHPVVENSITHGIVQNEFGKIKINAFVEDNECIVQIIDNGVGTNDEYRINQRINSSNTDDKKHIGLQSVHNRIQLIFPESVGVTFKSVINKGSETTLRWCI